MRDRIRAAADKVPARVVSDRPEPELVWNTGLSILTNRTRNSGGSPGINLFYIDLDYNVFFGPGEPLGEILRGSDQHPDANTFDAKGIILPWCFDSTDVHRKAIVVHRLDADSGYIEEALLYLFQYSSDNEGYYLPADFSSFLQQKKSLGEGPSSYLNVDFLFDSSGQLIAQASSTP